MTNDEKDQVITFLNGTRPKVTTQWLLGLGFENIGTSEWPIYRSPPQNRGGPVAYLFVDPLMGCDGWSIGGQADSSMIQPPNTKQEAMLLFMGLGLDLPLFCHEE